MPHRFECKHCLKTFKSKESRHHHLARYHGYDPVLHKCEKCPKIFKYREEYLVHMSESHQELNTRFECGQCASSFKHSHHLAQHVQLVHNPIKKIYNCEECDKSFQRRDGFVQHMKYVHSQTFTLYRCELCDRIYRSKAGLKLHVNMNHNENFKRSPCPLCPADFKWPHHLKQHISKVHIKTKPLNHKTLTNRCTLCFIQFGEKFDLLMHMRTKHNLDVDIYKCCQCPAVFNLKGPLERHLEDHKGSKGDHKCDQCYPVLNPKLYIEKQRMSNEDVIMTPEDEIIDFEVSLMEDPELRQLIKYKIRHLKTNDYYMSSSSQLEENNDYSADDISDAEDLNMNGRSTEGEAINMDNRVNEIQVVNMDNRVSGTECHKSIAENNISKNQIDDPEVIETMTEDIIECITAAPEIEVCESSIENDSIHSSQVSPSSLCEFACDKCDNSFATANSLSLHNQIMHSNIDATYESENSICSASEIPNTTLENTNKMKTRELVVKLIRVNKNIHETSDLNNEMGIKDTDTTKKHFKCKQCKETFKHIVELARHVRKSHAKKSTAFKCKYCTQTFTKVQLLGIHVRHKHKRNSKAIPSLEQQNNGKDHNLANTVIQPGSTEIENRESFKNIETSLEKLNAETDNNLINTIKELDASAVKKPTAFQCKHCPQSFTKKLLLSVHTRNKHKNNAEALFLEKSNNETNKSLVNEIIEPGLSANSNSNASKDTDANSNDQNSKDSVYECGKCALFFQSKLQLLRHISSKHMNIKNLKISKRRCSASKTTFDCPTCSESFTTKSDLENHLENHQAKSYKCVACSITFDTESEFTRHMKMEHRHKCGLCNIAFVHREKLMSHLQTQHKGRPKEHKCDICNTVFRLAASLAKHMDEKHKDRLVKEPQVVTREMEKVMHRCNHCGALFPLNESLQRHIQLEHDVGSVHKCGECTAVFNDIEEFKEHLQIEHIQIK